MNYHDINHCDMLNGEGIRVSLWVSGCSLHCKGCQNPQTWCFNSGIPFDDDALQELYEALDKPYIQGLTLTGGNPMDNVPEVLDICRKVKEKFPSKDIWLYTGYTYEELYYKGISRILLYVDVLVDGPYIEAQRDTSLQWRGSKNQRVINVPETLKQGKIITIQND